MNKDHLLSVENLSLSFGKDAPVLNGISFKVNKGEIIGLVGESGSGKSVSSLSIMQLLPKKAKLSGKITFEGTSLLDLNDKSMQSVRGKQISMIFQEPMSSLNPSHKCGDQVREAILIHQQVTKEQAKKQVLDLFDKVSLPDRERIYNSYPHELSGGQLQRIMIAMATANYPKLIIADEPTTALDVTVQKNIVDLLKSIRDEFGSSIIFISHDLGVVKSIADKVIVMQHGHIVEAGDVGEIFNNPSHPYTRGLIACRPPLDYRVKRLPTVQDFLSKSEADISTYINGLKLMQQDWSSNYDQVMQNDPLLSVTNLNKWYPTKTSWFGKTTEYFKAVKDVSFDLRKGEVLGLVGESGSGKTTCGRSLLRLIEPTSGQVRFDGSDIINMPKEELRILRKDFQIIFQDPYSSLNPRMKIGEAIMEPMTIHHLHNSKSQRKEKAIELLETVELKADHFDRYPHQFSGGQRQRICIARTLSLNPQFIVCDESVSALDVSVQAQILNLLLDLKDKYDLSYLFISHDISVIKFLCDNVMVMKDGEIVEKASAEDIYNNPKELYTQRLIEAIYK